MSKKYIVKEIFGPTIQGEGRHTGTACTFVRFSRCNRWNGRAESKPKAICNFCDTDFTGGDSMDALEIITQIRGKGTRAIVLSGGEPMLQIADGELVRMLKDKGYKVMIETNGSILPALGKVFPADITISPKQKSQDTHIPTFGADLKFLFPWIDPLIQPRLFSGRVGVKNIYIQPIDRPGEDNTQGAFKEVVELNRSGYENCFLSLQTHKFGGFQ